MLLPGGMHKHGIEQLSGPRSVKSSTVGVIPSAHLRGICRCGTIPIPRGPHPIAVSITPNGPMFYTTIRNNGTTVDLQLYVQGDGIKYQNRESFAVSGLIDVISRQAARRAHATRPVTPALEKFVIIFADGMRTTKVELLVGLRRWGHLGNRTLFPFLRRHPFREKTLPRCFS